MVTQPADPAITKAIAFLQRTGAKPTEIAATRALLVAGSKGYDIGHAIDDALGFLNEPLKWDPASRAEDAGALAAANRAGKAPDAVLKEAVKLLVGDQQTDGSFRTTLATWMARDALIESGKQPDDFEVVQIDKWFLSLTPENTVDASAAILALDQTSNVMSDALRGKCLGFLREGQAPGGGWGTTAVPPAFDTALAVLALATLDLEPRLARSVYRPEELKEAIARGRAYLVSQQKPDGSWPETVSTTGWVLLALLGK